jgi:hypothetical protein
VISSNYRRFGRPASRPIEILEQLCRKAAPIVLLEAWLPIWAACFLGVTQWSQATAARCGMFDVKIFCNMSRSIGFCRMGMSLNRGSTLSMS